MFSKLLEKIMLGPTWVMLICIFFVSGILTSIPLTLNYAFERYCMNCHTILPSKPQGILYEEWQYCPHCSKSLENNVMYNYKKWFN